MRRTDRFDGTIGPLSLADRFRVKAIVFDLDGVLVDSMPAIRAYWTGWAERHGVGPEVVLASLHLTAEELVRKFAPSLDASEEARVTAEGQAKMETGIRALEGGRALIDRLPPDRWGVVTSGRRMLALRHLALGNLPVPNVVVTAEDTPRGKPDPSGYLLAAERLGISSGDCLAVEDSPAGVRAARAAGMAVIAVTNTHPPDELAEADIVIDSLASLGLTIDQQQRPIEVIADGRGDTELASEPTRRIAIAPIVGPLGARIDELRRRWDPRMAARIESHVTVLYETPPPVDLERLVRATAPLRLRAGAVERWSAEPGIYVAVFDPSDDLRRFRTIALGTDDPAYRPHITLLHRDSVTSPRQADEAWAALRGERLDTDFVVSELVVHEEIGGGWREAARPRFGRDAV